MSALECISRELLKSNFKHLNGFLPVRKPAGICTNKLLHLLKCDIYFVLTSKNITHGHFDVGYSRFLEPFAEGVLTFSFGRGLAKRKNFALANFRYRTVIEFGAKRELHSIDGRLLSKSSVSHIDKESIVEELKTFTGEVNQKRLPVYAQPESEKALAAYRDYYERVRIDVEPRLPKESQKYPFVAPMRTFEVESLRLIDYSEPFAEIDISCQGCFSARQFALDLAGKFKTDASLVKLVRYKEGPMHLEDSRVLQIEDLNLEYYITRLSAFSKTYDEFNEAMSTMWEDKPT